MEKKKQVDLIINGFKELLDTGKDVHLLIGGKGPEMENLMQLTWDLNIENRVTFLGFISEEVLYDYYMTADLFTTADNADYDITTFVALALGPKCVVSRQHYFEKDIQSLDNLILVEPSPSGFCSGFIEALESKTGQNNPEAYRDILAGYSWEEYFRKVADTMERFCLHD